MKLSANDYVIKSVIALFIIINNSMVFAETSALDRIDSLIEYVSDNRMNFIGAEVFNQKLMDDFFTRGFTFMEERSGCKMVSSDQNIYGGSRELMSYPVSIDSGKNYRFQVMMGNILFPDGYITNIVSSTQLKINNFISKVDRFKTGEWTLLLVGLGLTLIQITRESYKEQSSYLRTFE